VPAGALLLPPALSLSTGHVSPCPGCVAAPSACFAGCPAHGSVPAAFCPLFLTQYAYNKHLTLRSGLQQPLLHGEAAAEDGRHDGGAQPAAGFPQQQQRYHFLASKLWWAGIALLSFALGLLALTVYTLVAPPV
jgi:hypothetical protein